MLFNSLQFLIFFPIVCLTIYLIPRRTRWIALLVASYIFYMSWHAAYALLLVGSTLIDFTVAKRIYAAQLQLQRRFWLGVSLLANLGLLFSFKYYNFAVDSLQSIFDMTGIFASLPESNLLLPVGISFYTFQTLSYTIDVYRGTRAPEKHLGIFGLYVSFFPQLVAGPIERSTRLMPQFHRELPFDRVRVASGLRQMAWGFFKKLVVADRLAIVVNQVYADPTEYSWFNLLLATIFFSFQIYCDFSGYSDIAIGAARVLGYDLMENFNLPYYARSIREFWSRWHISLSTWFRDYLYVPLGGNRVAVPRWYANLAIVFVVSGLWHGANWTFVIWGALHGLFYVLELTVGKRIISRFVSGRQWEDGFIHRGFQIGLTFTMVTFAWIFFRANSVWDALYIVQHLFEFSWPELEVSWGQVRLGLIAVALLELQQLAKLNGIQFGRFSTRSRFLRWSYDYFVIVVTLVFGVFSLAEFIYFQF